jgi:hypothetical protein
VSSSGSSATFSVTVKNQSGSVTFTSTSCGTVAVPITVN